MENFIAIVFFLCVIILILFIANRDSKNRIRKYNEETKMLNDTIIDFGADCFLLGWNAGENHEDLLAMLSDGKLGEHLSQKIWDKISIS